MRKKTKYCEMFYSDDDEEEDTNLYRDIINLIHYYIRRLYYRTRKFRRVGWSN